MTSRLFAAMMVAVGVTACGDRASVEVATDRISPAASDPMNDDSSIDDDSIDDDGVDSDVDVDVNVDDDRVEPAVFLSPLEPNAVVDPLKVAIHGGLTAREYEEAVEVHVVPCMRERGWDYEYREPRKMDYVSENAPDRAGALADFLRAEGSRTWFAFPAYDNENYDPAEDPYWKYYLTLDDDEQQEYDLDFDGGEDNCLGRATGIVNEELGVDPIDTQRKYGDYIEAHPEYGFYNPDFPPDEKYSVDDPEIAARLNAQEAGWVSCMVEAGFPEAEEFPSLWDLFHAERESKESDPSTVWDETERDDFERRLVTADVACNEIHVWPVIHYRQALFVQQLIDEGIIPELKYPFDR